MLNEIDPEQMTPLEALNILCSWKKLAEGVKPLNTSNMNKKKPIADDKTRTKNIPPAPSNELSLFD